MDVTEKNGSIFFDNCSFSLKNKKYFMQSKKVQFHILVDVVLIPCLEEYSGFKEQLWYDEDDYVQFYTDAKYNTQEMCVLG